MITPAERITFILTRGFVALALVGAGVFCINIGVSFWTAPRQETANLGIDILGLTVTADGLGAVIFGAGVAICFLAYRTAPRQLESSEREMGGGALQRITHTRAAAEQAPPRSIISGPAPQLAGRDLDPGDAVGRSPSGGVAGGAMPAKGGGAAGGNTR